MHALGNLTDGREKFFGFRIGKAKIAKLAIMDYLEFTSTFTVHENGNVCFTF